MSQESIIVQGAQMQCDKGAAPMPITVVSQQFVQIQNKLVATQADVAPMVNIPSFGACPVLQGPCVPAPTAWQNTSPSFLDIEGMKKLTTDSFCMCGVGGRISFLDSGQQCLVIRNENNNKRKSDNDEHGHRVVLMEEEDAFSDKKNGIYY